MPHRDDAGIREVPPSFDNPCRADFHGSWQAIDGFSGSPDLAEADLGRRFFDVAARRARAFVEFRRAADAVPVQ